MTRAQAKQREASNERVNQHLGQGYFSTAARLKQKSRTGVTEEPFVNQKRHAQGSEAGWVYSTGLLRHSVFRGLLKLRHGNVTQCGRSPFPRQYGAPLRRRAWIPHSTHDVSRSAFRLDHTSDDDHDEEERDDDEEEDSTWARVRQMAATMTHHDPTHGNRKRPNAPLAVQRGPW